MPEPAEWQPCQFGDDGDSLERPSIHDNFVYALTVHLEGRCLTIHTQYRDGSGPGELADLRFVGVVAHHFDDVAAPSILLGIDRTSPGWIVRQWGPLIESRRKRGWPPIDSSDPADLSAKLAARGVHGYRISGSCGLDGFILAEGAEYRLRDRPVVFP